MKNSIATAGLVAFLAVDVALVGLALRSGHTTPTALPAASTVTSPDVATSEPTSPEPRPTGSTGSAAKDAVPVKRLISAVDAKTAWRATTGTCSQGKSSIEVTSDGGKTWTKLTSPSRAIARVQMLDSSRVFVIGAGANCELKQYSSRDAGDTWQPPATASGGWARRLDKSSQVLAPQEPATTP